MRELEAVVRSKLGRFVPGFLLLLCSSTIGAQQQGNQTAAVDKQGMQQTMQQLLQRIDQLEARVAQLEASRKPDPGNMSTCSMPADPPDPPVVKVAETASLQHPLPSHPVTASQTAPVSPSESEQAQTENAMNDRMDLSKTLLRIRGFGDVSFHDDSQPGDYASFALGQLDLFITSDMSDRYKFLSEVVFEAGPDNIYGTQVGPENSFSVDIERYLLQFSYNDYLNLAVGRGHTAIGYYNTAYHHSTWLQTTTERPFLFEFEDRGGILPVHIVGASASGLVPSGPLGLHYAAEIGNGRESRSPLDQEPVQNEISDQNGKAFNLALFSKPQAWQGFQAGFSLYHDALVPANSPRIAENILAAHAVLIRPKYEWLNEAMLVRHAQSATPSVFNTPAFYSQLSRQFGSYRPYFRYEYVNVPPDEPVFPDVALRHGPLVGMRFDPNESVALKLEYQYTLLRNQPAVSGITAQVGFTF